MFRIANNQTINGNVKLSFAQNFCLTKEMIRRFLKLNLLISIILSEHRRSEGRIPINFIYLKFFSGFLKLAPLMEKVFQIILII